MLSCHPVMSRWMKAQTIGSIPYRTELHLNDRFVALEAGS